MQTKRDFWRRTMLCAGGLLGLGAMLFCPDINPANAHAASRTLRFYNIHTKEYLTVTYKVNDRYVPSAMKKIDHFMRDWRANKEHKMNPELIDLIWTIYTQLGAKKPINLISGYRSPTTNERLRRAGGGQARHSQHMLGKAADIQIPGVPVRTLRNSALINEWGGVGYYPRSGWPFVHVDVGRVRMWPRIPRLELAALFPSGHSDYIPSDGRKITPKDYQVAAKSRKYQLAAQVFHNHLVPGTMLADAGNDTSPTPPLPTPSPNRTVALASASVPSFGAGLKPTPVSYRPQMSIGEPAQTAAPKLKPASAPRPAHKRYILASADGSALESVRKLIHGGRPTGSAYAEKRAYQNTNVMAVVDDDDEHPEEELSFHHYSVAALTSDQPVGYDRTIAPLVHPEQHDLSYMLEDPIIPQPLELRDSAKVMALAATQGFSGPAVRGLYAALPDQRPTQLASR